MHPEDFLTKFPWLARVNQANRKDVNPRDSNPGPSDPQPVVLPTEPRRAGFKLYFIYCLKLKNCNILGLAHSKVTLCEEMTISLIYLPVSNPLMCEDIFDKKFLCKQSEITVKFSLTDVTNPSLPSILMQNSSNLKKMFSK